MSYRSELPRVLTACIALEPLSKFWEPCGSLVEDAMLAVADQGGGLTGVEFQRLEVWSKRWLRLDKRLQELYASNPAHNSVNAALWLLFRDKASDPPSEAVYGALGALWKDKFGYSPSIELVPIYDVRKGERQNGIF